MDGMLADLRFALRSLYRHKVFTLATIATLALGIGANTAVFGVVNAVLIDELPVRNPGELVIFYWLRRPDPMVPAYSGYGRPVRGGAGLRTSFSYVTFERFRDHSRTFANVFAIAPLRDINVSAGGQTDTVSAHLASGAYFDGLGIQASLGRTFGADDDKPDSEPVAVISHRYWRRRFAGDPAVIGMTVLVNRLPVTIVGVTPKGFEGTRVSESTDLAIPLAMASRLTGAARPSSLWWVEIMGRLKEGVTQDQALADVQSMFDETVRESWAARTASSANQKGTSFPQLGVMAGSRGAEGPRRDAVPMLASFFAVAGAVLLIGCVNVANLVLVRTLTRRQELALRVALGASRRRVLRQVLTESLILSLGGALAGMVLAFWARGFLDWLPSSDAPVVNVTMDLRVWLFAAGLSVLSAVLFGFGPALRATRSELSVTSRPLSRQRRGIVRRGLVVAQVAVSLVVLVTAGLFLQTLHNLSRVDVGFDTSNLLVFRVNPGTTNDRDAGAPKAFQLLDEIREALEAVPGVQSASMSVMPVLAQAEWSAPVAADSGGAPRPAFIQAVGPAFFETMKMPILSGRTLTPADREGTPRVAVINQTMARQVFGDDSPLGRQLRFVDGPDRTVRLEVVGVVRDAAYARVQDLPPPTLYRPHRQVGSGSMTFEVRTAVEPLSLVPAVRAAVRRVDPALALSGVKSQAQQINETLAMPHALAVVTSAFGLVGLLLACIGLYGLVSFDVTLRTSEVGIRMALGAQRADVVWLVVRETAGVVAIGALVGLLAAIAVAGAARSVLFGVSFANPIAVVAATLLLAAAAGLAAYLPARRASGLDPVKALRCD